MKKCKEFEIKGKQIKKIIEEFPPKRVRKENGCMELKFRGMGMVVR